MNKFLTAKIILLIILLVILIGKNNHLVLADWYTRSDIRPTQPSIERNLPTVIVEPTVGTQATPTTTAPPPIGDPGVTNTPAPTAVPTAVPTAASSNNSSSTSTSDGNDSSGSTPYFGPQVLGLSDTAGEGLQPSDIILLAGILCLTLYLRSKLTVKQQD